MCLGSYEVELTPPLLDEAKPMCTWSDETKHVCTRSGIVGTLSQE